MPLILAIEPDARQGAVLQRIVRDHVHAELVLVDSPDTAVASLATQIPDVILVSMLLAPADEEDLIDRLRSLDGGRHIQTYTIPQFASTPADLEDASGRFLGKLRKKKGRAAAHTPGCDPDLFATEVVTFLSRAQELKEQSEGEAARMLRLPPRDASIEAHAEGATDMDVPDAAAPEDSSWASPFEWRRTSSATKPTKARVARPEQSIDALHEAELPVHPAAADAGVLLEDGPGGDSELTTDAIARAVGDQRPGSEEHLSLEELPREGAPHLNLERDAAVHGVEEDRLMAALEEAAGREQEIRERAAAEAALQLEAEATAQRLEAERLEREAAAEEERRLFAALAEHERVEEAARQAEAAVAQQNDEAAPEAGAAGAPQNEGAAPLAAQLAESGHAAVVDPEQVRHDRLAAAQETARRRREEKARKAALARQSRRPARPQPSSSVADHQPGHEPPARPGLSDPYAEFREEHDHPRGPMRLLPVDAWARIERLTPDRGVGEEPNPLHGLIAGLSVPAHVAVVSYPRGCRIRRVRVRTIALTDDDLREAVIVSRSALDATRGAAAVEHR